MSKRFVVRRVVVAVGWSTADLAQDHNGDAAVAHGTSVIPSGPNFRPAVSHQPHCCAEWYGVARSSCC